MNNKPAMANLGTPVRVIFPVSGSAVDAGFETYLPLIYWVWRADNGPKPR